jgi:PUA-domain protein
MNMADLRLRHRHRLRRKELRALADDLLRSLGCGTFSEDDVVETAETGEFRLMIFKNRAYGMFIGEEPFLTLHGLMAFRPTRRYMTVDMGAVRFIANGADVMAPGVIDADLGIQEGDAVWVRDERNLKPLCVGQALMDSSSLISGNEGKGVRTLHYVGDKIWALGTE